MASSPKITVVIDVLSGLLSTSEYELVKQGLALTAEILEEGPSLMDQLRTGTAKRAKLKSQKQLTVVEKKAIMKQLRQIRSNLGSIVRLNFRGTPLVVILEMQTRYKTVTDQQNNVSRKPRYDHREATERTHFQMLIDNLATLPDSAREVMTAAGWTIDSELELADAFMAWDAASKKQNLLEGQLAVAAADGRDLLKQATHWYRNARLAAKSLRNRRPELAGLIDNAFPRIDPVRRTPKPQKKQLKQTPPQPQPQAEPADMSNRPLPSQRRQVEEELAELEAMKQQIRIRTEKLMARCREWEAGNGESDAEAPQTQPQMEETEGQQTRHKAKTRGRKRRRRSA